MLEITLCNELMAEDGLSLAQQAEVARELGYCGLELAPATLGKEPHRLDATQVTEIRRTVEDAGLRVTGLHWLLSGYPAASITDRACWADTREILIGLVGLCAALGGEILIHGSPGQRVRPKGMDDAALIACLAEFFAPVAKAAERAGVTYCIEPLAQMETDTITTVAEGAALVDAIASRAFRTMIDCKAVGLQEPPVADCIRTWLPTGAVTHVHANDTNLGAPGMGDDPFHDIMQALIDNQWQGQIGVEPFRTVVDAKVTAAIGIATLRAHERHAR
ncbi:MAG: sugar phosphate isomerase/epimerase family protein [Pseudomonadota bacterium]